jgi:hypothetical protein
VATARFIDTVSLGSSESFAPPLAPAKNVSVIALLWPLLAAFLLMLLCCCLVLLLIWRRRKTEYSTKTDEAGVEPGAFMFDEEGPFYPHEYWNPLDESASGALMLDIGDGEEDILELSDSGLVDDDFFEDDLDISEPNLELEDEDPDFGHEYWNPLDESASDALMLDMGDFEEDLLDLSDSGLVDDDFFEDDLDISEPSLELEDEGLEFGHEYWNPLDDGRETLHEADVENSESGADGPYSDPDDLMFTDRPSSDQILAFASDSGYGGWGLYSEGSHLNLSPDFEEARAGGLEEEDIDDLASDTQDLAFEDDYGFE